MILFAFIGALFMLFILTTLGLLWAGLMRRVPMLSYTLTALAVVALVSFLTRWVGASGW